MSNIYRPRKDSHTVKQNVNVKNLLLKSKTKKQKL